LLAAATAVLLVAIPATKATSLSRPAVSRFAVSSGRPFAGDDRLYATISPNADGARDQASISFTLARPATTLVPIRPSWPVTRMALSRRLRLAAGRHTIVWAPAAGMTATTYSVRIRISEPHRRARWYGRARRGPGLTPVIRVLGIEAAFGRASYRPES